MLRYGGDRVEPEEALANLFQFTAVPIPSPLPLPPVETKCQDVDKKRVSPMESDLQPLQGPQKLKKTVKKIKRRCCGFFPI
jgi:hypothetical protein